MFCYDYIISGFVRLFVWLRLTCNFAGCLVCFACVYWLFCGDWCLLV